MAPGQEVTSMNRLMGFGLVGAIAGVLEVTMSAWAEAQGTGSARASGAATEPAGGAGSIVAVAIIAALVIGIVVMVKMIDARRRREDRLAGVQGRLSDALAGDAMFARLPLTVTVDAPKWGSGPAVVTIAGTVPTDEMRMAARALVENEARARLEDVELDDRLLVDPLAWRRAA